jgi:hypothetical protein
MDNNNNKWIIYKKWITLERLERFQLNLVHI